MSIRVFNADDHPILCKGISHLIQQTDGMEWVGSADNGKDALVKIKAMQPDVAILDIEMPHLSGIEVAKNLLEEGTHTQFVLLTLFKDRDFLNRALALGVKGFLLKESTEREILDCIRFVSQGKAYVNAAMTQYIVNMPASSKNVLSQLSDHEVNILKLIARQKTSNEIADMLFISPKTVANHRTNISKKLELNGEQNGLLKWAIEHKDLLG
ncbi:MAG: response regulator transcription factor [Saprospiraceae bacterium]